MNRSLPGFCYLERYRNKGTRTYSSHASDSEAADYYRPDSKYDHFELPAFEVPRSQLNIYTASPPHELASKYLRPSGALFCIHPQVLAMCPGEAYVRRILAESAAFESIPVIPSSSTRTLLAADVDTPHALKVHFPFKVSRYTRKMRGEVIEQAINVSRELEQGIDHLDEDFAFLREVIGVAHINIDPDSARGENWGYLVRDMVPFPRRQDVGNLVPGFALYGEDYFDPAAQPLLFDLVGKRDPVAYILDNIMLPIVRHWIGCFLKFGFMLEPHGQNVLLELDDDYSVSRIVHRDLSVGIDMRRRQEIGLPDNDLNNYNRTLDSAFQSVTYDRFMGGHFFSRLVTTCQNRYPDISKDAFTQPCRDEFMRLLPEYAHYFPGTVWYFSEERDQFNKPYYVDTGAIPEWRP
ncbi:MAG: IucA/IucC family protein [Candidatus Promineifilaceae bacterium]